MLIRNILTNHPGANNSETWAKHTYILAPKTFFPFTVINDLYNGYRLFHLRSKYDAIVLGGNSKQDISYLILQRLFPFRKRPIVKTECLWFESSPAKQLVKVHLFKWLDRLIDRYIVYARREIVDYAKAFRLPQSKFVFISYHTTVDLDKVTIEHGDYLFSGGNFARDYSTLAKAVKGLDLQVIIACNKLDTIKGIKFPDNVTVVDVGPQRFRQLMARSGINVVALAPGLLHSGGQQTFLNAMAMGKPVIVTDPEGAQDYIEDGVDGILVPPSDSGKLRSAILKIHNSPNFAMRLGQAAMKKAVKWDTEAHLCATLSLAHNLTDTSK